MSSGSYLFDKLHLEPESQVWVDDAEGPVVLYVTNDVIVRGQFLDAMGNISEKLELLVVALGTSSMPVERSFFGTLFVPNGSLNLAAVPKHVGAFFAKNIEVQPNTLIEHRPFPWNTLLPPTLIKLADAPVILTPVLTASGGIGVQSPAEQTAEDSIGFKIPDHIRVRVGNAGNGIVRATGSPSGKAGSPNRTALLQLASGVTCTVNGKGAHESRARITATARRSGVPSGMCKHAESPLQPRSTVISTGGGGATQPATAKSAASALTVFLAVMPKCSFFRPPFKRHVVNANRTKVRLGLNLRTLLCLYGAGPQT